MPRALTGFAAAAAVLVGFWTVRLRLSGFEAGVAIRSLEDLRDRERLRVEELRCTVASLEGPGIVLDREHPPADEAVSVEETVGGVPSLEDGRIAATTPSRTL